MPNTSSTLINRIRANPVNKGVGQNCPAAPLAAGTYKVVWNAVSVDTHKSNGEYSFKVGQ